MDDKPIDEAIGELKRLLDKLRDATFTGIGISKWYPEGSQTAYYRMEYSPGKLIVKHKSPSAPVEEIFDVNYHSANDLNIASIALYAGTDLYKKYSEEDLNGLPADEGMGIINKCGFKDPRWMLGAAETVQEVAGGDPDAKTYLIKVWDESFDPDLGLKVFAMLLVEKGILKAMGVKKFIGSKEIASQYMEIIFQYPRTETASDAEDTAGKNKETEDPAASS